MRLRSLSARSVRLKYRRLMVLTDRQRHMLNKVPEITLYFWVIKVLCTTVGETAADFLNIDLGFGLTGTSIATGLLLAVLLFAQFRTTRYVAGLYWATVALVSVFGTLVTDNLTDNLGVPLQTSTIVFGVLLIGVFGAWYSSEGTLSMHSIVTTRREAFYWLAVLVTFALGTATGDLMSEALSLGYFTSALIVAGVIAVFVAAWRLGLDAVLAFWIVYILTRPLGASLGDLLAQSKDQGGLGVGSTATSIIFLAAILGTVVYLSVVKPDVTPTTEIETVTSSSNTGGLWQTAVVVMTLLVVCGGGYAWRKADLTSSSNSATEAKPQLATGSSPTATSTVTSPNAALGDLSQFRTITQDTLDLLNAGNQSSASSRITDLETAWDKSQGRLQAKDKKAWTRVDGKIDTALSSVRSKHPDAHAEKQALTSLLSELR